MRERGKLGKDSKEKITKKPPQKRVNYFGKRG